MGVGVNMGQWWLGSILDNRVWSKYWIMGFGVNIVNIGTILDNGVWGKYWIMGFGVNMGQWGLG